MAPLVKRSLPVLILLIAALARFGALAEDVRFHGDEALFATYARNAAVYGDWLLSGPLDKPPLSLYAMALSMQFTGVSRLPDGVLMLEPKRGEWSARLPGALAGIVTVAFVMAAAHRVGGRRAGWLAGALAALSPQLVAFDATAFTDPLLLTFLTASVAAALYGHAGPSGLLLAAAFATKQQAVLYAPLLFLLMFAIRPAGIPQRPAQRPRRNFLLGLTVGAGALLLWDAARPEPSFFAYAADNNNPYRWLVPPAEWADRLRLWLTFGANAFGAWPVTLGVALSALVPLWNRKAERDHRDIATNRRSVSLHFFVRSASLWFRLYILSYIFAHIVLPFNIYDRYLLLLYPLLIVLAARTLVRLTPPTLIGSTIALALLFSLTAPARFPSDVRDRHDGLIALADIVNRQGLGTIVYNRWLGWEMGYYLGPWSDKRVVYYPSPMHFADDAPRNPDPAPRLLIAPTWADVGPWLATARQAGFADHIAHRTADYAAWWLARD